MHVCMPRSYGHFCLLKKLFEKADPLGLTLNNPPWDSVSLAYLELECCAYHVTVTVTCIAGRGEALVSQSSREHCNCKTANYLKVEISCSLLVVLFCFNLMGQIFTDPENTNSSGLQQAEFAQVLCSSPRSGLGRAQV